MKAEDIRSIGLVLSGGGAKGAYHVGLFRALEALGLLGRITAISGSSIGALNMTLLTAGGTAAAQAAWDDMCGDRMVPGLSPAETQERIDALYARIAREGVDKARFCTEDRWHLASGAALRGRLARFAPDFPADAPETYACVYCIEQERPHYIRLNGLSRARRDDVVTASCSVPGLLPPVALDGLHFTDGGFCPPVCDARSRVDVVPLHPLRGRHFDLLILGYLFDNPGKNLSGVPADTRVVELFPHEDPAWTQDPTSPMDFDPARQAVMLRRGYENAMTALGGILNE